MNIKLNNIIVIIFISTLTFGLCSKISAKDSKISAKDSKISEKYHLIKQKVLKSIGIKDNKEAYRLIVEAVTNENDFRKIKIKAKKALNLASDEDIKKSCRYLLSICKRTLEVGETSTSVLESYTFSLLHPIITVENSCDFTFFLIEFEKLNNKYQVKKK